MTVILKTVYLFKQKRQRKSDLSPCGGLAQSRHSAHIFEDNETFLHPRPASFHTCWPHFGISVLAGVDGGAVRVTGAKGIAPSCDYKVQPKTQPCLFLWNGNISLPFCIRPGVCYLPGWVQGDSCLSGRRTTCSREGPSDC